MVKKYSPTADPTHKTKFIMQLASYIVKSKINRKSFIFILFADTTPFFKAYCSSYGKYL